jgi:hypothetical protein
VSHQLLATDDLKSMGGHALVLCKHWTILHKGPKHPGFRYLWEGTVTNSPHRTAFLNVTELYTW